MSWIALKMLTGDRGKYLAIIFGVTFGCLLIAQQSAVFCGVMQRTHGSIRDTRDADIWVMNAHTQYLDDNKAISDNALLRVRGVPGVAWAVNLYRGMAQIQMSSGKYQSTFLLGIDDATLAGAPVEMLIGKAADLRSPDAVLVDEAGFHQLWPGEPLQIGKVIEMNDRRAVVVGIFRGSQTFMTYPVVYTRFSLATLYVSPARRLQPYVLVKGQPGLDVEQVSRRIEERTGLKALTREEFIEMTISYYMNHTGIPMNFGCTVLLGFMVGCAIAGQTFYLFTVENLKQFAALKAMGMSDWRLVRMILTQALVVGSIGYGLGVGLATAFGLIAQECLPLLAFHLAWQVLVCAAAAVLLICLLSSLLCMRRVLVLEPAMVFQG
jgi:putative ABC transport system permease protein